MTNNIKSERVRLDMTQEDLADEIGVDAGTIRHWERGDTDVPSSKAAMIHGWHLDNGWSGAGYHFLVRKDGKVYALRPESKVGSHAQGANSDSIGICFEGNFMTETMSQAQTNAGNELVNYLKAKYGISKVQRHKEVCSTNYPGTNFPFAAVTASKKAGWVKNATGWFLACV